MIRFLLISILSFLPIVLKSQDILPKLFIKCDRCDQTYIRKEINYVDHVRDQALANIQLFIYRNRNANNGNRYTLDFIGNEFFSDKNISLLVDTNPKMTRDEIRSNLKKRIELGLVYYLIETDISNKISVTYDSAILRDEIESSSDKWNNWVFQSAGDANFENETSRKKSNINLQFDADKVTDKIKLQFDLDFERSNDRYESDDDIFTSRRNRKSFSMKSVWSVSEKWSAGFSAGASSDTYQNIDFRYHILPAIEYSFFPYNEFVRREMVINYRIGYGYRNYIEKTIYDKLREDVYVHFIGFETRFRQPWGEINTNLSGKSFLQDPDKYSLRLDSWFSIRVFEGLSVRLGGELELIRDQLSLPMRNVSIEDLLLQQKEIATDFFTEFRIGLSYTFGSAYNNYLNSRL
ncbi:MAG: hypothetical protein CMB81_02035 [Flammeovirgaceae bacterium]|jgi:hypothetical protein|nr:hypothetical protein [Flammeovirgaceae bacterium]|tara:strand:- start:1359 stop:2579 length:1221 start_codon:yes stop_codon:yes gene_type:complete